MRQPQAKREEDEAEADDGGKTREENLVQAKLAGLLVSLLRGTEIVSRS